MAAGMGAGVPAAGAEDFTATIGAFRVTVPFPEGTRKTSDNTPKGTSAYRFVFINQQSETPKLDLGWIISAAGTGVPTNQSEAEIGIRAIMAEAGYKIPPERIRTMVVSDANPDFVVYWAPYYHLATGNAQAPYAIYKPTVLVHTSGTLVVTIQLTGVLPFADAGPQDLQMAERVMDQLLLAAVKGAVVHPE